MGEVEGSACQTENSTFQNMMLGQNNVIKKPQELTNPWGSTAMEFEWNK